MCSAAMLTRPSGVNQAVSEWSPLLELTRMPFRLFSVTRQHFASGMRMDGISVQRGLSWLFSMDEISRLPSFARTTPSICRLWMTQALAGELVKVSTCDHSFRLDQSTVPRFNQSATPRLTFH